MNIIEQDKRSLEASLRIMQKMYSALREVPVDDAMRHISEFPADVRKKFERKDGKDTRYFDMLAEEALSVGTVDCQGHISSMIGCYDQSGIVITEERGKLPGDVLIQHNTPVIISDPVDRSSYLEELPEKHGRARTMGELFDAEKNAQGALARIDGCNSSVTLIRENDIKYTVVLNLFNGEVFVANPEGIFHGSITEDEPEDIMSGEEIHFCKNESIDMVCYSKGEKYDENRKGTHLRFFNLVEDVVQPGGPIRFTYLLDDSSRVGVVGLIANNGEKIQESLPNIAMAYFSKGELQAYKLFCDPKYSQSRSGRALTPNLMNSLFDNGKILTHGIKSQFLGFYDYPSQFRDTTVVVPKANKRALTMLEGMVGRDYAIRIV